MDKRFFKTFMRVNDLPRAAAFFHRLGFEHAPGDPRPTRHWLWIDPGHTQLLVLAQTTEQQPWFMSHHAFDVDLETLRGMRAWLEERGVTVFISDFGREPVEAVVHNWIPAASLSFRDPDGNHIELSARLPGRPIPAEHLPPPDKHFLYLSEWETLRASLPDA
ncbi:MAG: VOC family protein [Chloroflexota bacterium]|nr:MAG: VOC family protein [Chloroflexota bacterium]